METKRMVWTLLGLLLGSGLISILITFQADHEVVKKKKTFSFGSSFFIVYKHI